MKLLKTSDLKNYQRELEYSYAFGAFVTIELIRNRPNDVFCVLVDESFVHQDAYEKLASLCTEKNIPLYVDQKNISRLRNKENCYVIGVFAKQYYPVKPGKHVILENIEDDGKLGTILRSMNGFDFDSLILINPQVDYYHPHVIRSSMGAFFHVPIKTYDSIEKYQHDFSNQKVYLCHHQGINKIKSMDNKEKNFSLYFANSFNEKYPSIQLLENFDLENNANILFFHFYEN